MRTCHEVRNFAWHRHCTITPQTYFLIYSNCHDVYPLWSAHKIIANLLSLHTGLVKSWKAHCERVRGKLTIWHIQILFLPPAGTLIGLSPWESEGFFFSGGANSGFFIDGQKDFGEGGDSDEILFFFSKLRKQFFLQKLQYESIKFQIPRWSPRLPCPPPSNTQALGLQVF